MKTRNLIALLAITAIVPATTFAVPAWSRQAGASCASCHATPTMQLNKTGLDFLKNGHRAEALKVSAEDMKWDHYFSLVWKGRVFSDQLDGARTGLANTQKPTLEFEQHSFSIYTGGALADRFSYFTELYLSENTGATSGANLVQGDAARKKLAEAFIQYNHPLGDDGESFLAVRAGEILPGILHVFGVGARSAEQRAIVLNEALAGNSNTYRPFSRQQGLDATIVNKHFELAAGIVNGSDTSTTNSIDADSDKDIFLSGLYNFDENESAIGAFYYKGKFSNFTVKQDFTTPLLYKNDFYKAGLMGRYIQDKWRLVGTYFTGEETINVTGSKASNAGFYALADYNFSDTYGVFARYDRLDPNTDIDNNEVSMVLLGFNMMLYQSEKSGARLQFEYSRKQTYLGGNITTAGTTKFNDDRFFAQVTWGF
ncbi:MAG: hypothetical protein PSV13_04265 [Lacunisphaera sp.]|nr:hypothetical protein [Lacunisphaera sp.]